MNELNTNTLSLDDVSFEVKMEDIYTRSSGKEIRIPSYKCLMNVRDNFPISIVSDNYKVITNLEAYAYGVECLRKLSGEKSLNVEVKRIISNSKYSVCHIDLWGKGLEVTVFNQDLFFPFVRITNSYNRSRSLRFDFGFIRQWCENGAIIETEVISIILPHSKNVIKGNVTFEFQNDKFDDLRNRFIDYVKQLKNIDIDLKYFNSLFFRALELTIPNKDSGKQIWSNYGATLTSINKLKEKYINELGLNGYAFFNIITEFSSSRMYNDGKPSLMVNTYQIRAGKWLKQFLSDKQKDSFNWNAYLGAYVNLPETV